MQLQLKWAEAHGRQSLGSCVKTLHCRRGPDALSVFPQGLETSGVQAPSRGGTAHTRLGHQLLQYNLSCALAHKILANGLGFRSSARMMDAPCGLKCFSLIRLSFAIRCPCPNLLSHAQLNQQLLEVHLSNATQSSSSMTLMTQKSLTQFQMQRPSLPAQSRTVAPVLALTVALVLARTAAPAPAATTEATYLAIILSISTAMLST